MTLPPPLVKLRSFLAHALGLTLRPFLPITLRLDRFCNEVHARAHLSGKINYGVQFIGRVTVEGAGRVEIGDGVRIGRRVFFETYGDAVIRIGNHVTINDNVTMVAYEGLTIGDYCMIGELASIRDANHGMQLGTPVRRQPHEAAAVTLGRDVWIGRAVYIGKGVAIGDGAVVGANSVVTRTVEKYTIVAGAPARPIGKRGTQGPKACSNTITPSMKSEPSNSSESR